jgi:hypothetical protein
VVIPELAILLDVVDVVRVVGISTGVDDEVISVPLITVSESLGVADAEQHELQLA